MIKRKKKSITSEDYTVDVFTDLSISEAQIQDAKKILMEAGYRIIPPLIVNGSINSKKKLIDYFYMRLDAKHPHRQQLRIKNPVFDMSIVSKFVDSQMEGTNEQTAIQQCVSIIDALFDYEEEFDFKYPIADIGALGQGKMAWITAKAITILTHKKQESMEKEAIKKIEDIERSYEIDANTVSTNLDELLKKMEEDNGKE